MAGLADIPTLRSRWKSKRHVGTAKPYLKVWVRKVRIRRRFDGSQPRYSFIPQASNDPYVGYLEVHSLWEEVPNVKSVEIDQTFDQQGLSTATLDMDNVEMVQHSGVAGLFHTIERGWFSPFRGYRPPNRPATHPTKNEWYETFREKSTQVMVVAGYGDARVPIFTGLIGVTELGSRPDKNGLTIRDFGQLLTDQRAFAWAKHPQVLDPITFADRLKADNVTQEGTTGSASSEDDGNPVRLAVDGDNDTLWLSKPHDHPQGQPWMSIKVPGGRYASVRINPSFAGLSCFISIFKPNDGHWIDEGKGYTNDGIPYIKFIPTLAADEKGYQIPEHQLGDNATIRFTFTNLAKHNGGWRAGVNEVSAARRKLSSEAKNNRWILVDDASDVVRTILQWMGLTDWEVESTGVRLSDKLVFNRQTSFMEIIQKIAELTNYVFFLKPPEQFDESNLASAANNSMGVAVFRSNQAMPGNPRDTIESVADSDLLTGIQAQFSDEPLPQHIRTRGKPLKKAKGGRALGGDRTPRVMAGYLPPWSREDSIGNAGIKKVIVHYDNMLSTVQECVLANIFIAFRAALESAKAQIQFPAFPPIQLDNQTAIFDKGTGLSTRLWVTQRHITVSTGEDAKFVMTLGGALIDFPDIVEIRRELALALQDAGFNPYPLATPTLADIGGPSGGVVF